MQPHEKSAQRKAAAGYILLAILLFLALSGAWQALTALTGNDPTTLRLTQRRQATYRLATLIQQTEATATQIGTGDASVYTLYRRLTGETIDSLQALAPYLDDSIQKNRLDTLAALIAERRKSVEAWLRLNGQDISRLYEEQLRKLAEQASTEPQPRIQRRTVTQTETQTTPAPKKSFFRKLGDLFSANRHDSTTVTTTRQEEIIDTILYNGQLPQSADTLWRQAEAQIQHIRQTHIAQRMSHAARLRRQGAETSRRVARLFSDFQEEEQLILQQREHQAAKVRQQSAFFLGGLAIFALLLAGGFSFMVQREFSRSRRYRLALEAANQKAHDLLNVREKLMLAVTHDIKAPVGTMLGYADLLKETAKDNAKARSYLENIQAAGNHLLALIRSLLDFHKLDARKMETDTVPFEPEQLFYTIYEAFLPQANSKGLELKYQPGDHLKGLFTGDALRIRQITENLLTNAIKFTQQGRVTMRTAYTGSSLLITITDTGRGMSQSEIPHLFREFTRLSNAQGAEGFGLGLAVTRKLTDLLKGNISAESPGPGKGSTFRVSLPLPRLNREPQPPEPKRKTAVKRIFILDDDHLQSELTERLLATTGLEITIGNQPSEALEAIRNEPYDALLTDIQMPGMDGFELVRRLREAERNTTHHTLVLAVTARDDLHTETLLSHGFDGCLHKPFTRDDVYRLLKIGKNSHEYKPVSDDCSWAGLLAFAAGDPTAENEILQTFITENQTNIEQMRKAISRKDGETLSAIAHKARPTYTLLQEKKAESLLASLDKQRNKKQTDEQMCKEAQEAITLMEEYGEKARKRLASKKDTNLSESSNSRPATSL